MTRGVSVAEFRGLAVAVRLSALLCVCASLCWAVGCSQGMQGLVDGLDDMLLIQSSPEPGSDRFNASEMLSDKYVVSKDATLSLTAPKSASYKWQLYKMVTEERTYEGYTFSQTRYEDMDIGKYIQSASKSFVLYVPDVDEMTPGTYRLILTVKDDTGNVYVDSCALIIYEPCYDLGDYNLPT